MPTRVALRVLASMALCLAIVACAGGATSPGVPTPTPTCALTPSAQNGSASPTGVPCAIGATSLPSAASPGPTTSTGESWTGRVDIGSTSVYPNPEHDTCRDGWALTFGFVVDPAGKVQGSGTGDLTSPPVCPFPLPVVSWQHVTFAVLGERSNGTLVLRFALATHEPAGGATAAGFVAMFGGGARPEGGPPVTVPIAGKAGTAEGTWRFESGNPAAVYSASGTITITCTACA